MLYTHCIKVLNGMHIHLRAEICSNIEHQVTYQKIEIPLKKNSPKFIPSEFFVFFGFCSYFSFFRKRNYSLKKH